jgi:hypothetical protein
MLTSPVDFTRLWRDTSVRPASADLSHSVPKRASESWNKCAKVVAFVSVALVVDIWKQRCKQENAKNERKCEKPKDFEFVGC